MLTLGLLSTLGFYQAVEKGSLQSNIGIAINSIIKPVKPVAQLIFVYL